MEELQICSENYKRWKEIALSSNNIDEIKKALKRAFFWLELHSAFLFLNSIEKVKNKDEKLNLKLIKAKAKICEKLTNYAEELLKETFFH